MHGVVKLRRWMLVSGMNTPSAFQTTTRIAEARDSPSDVPTAEKFEVYLGYGGKFKPFSAS